MFVELQDLGFDEGALDADGVGAGKGVADGVRVVALHEEAEGAEVLADGVVGAEAGDVDGVAVDVMVGDGLG